jgi:hypothetical protein
MTGAIAAIAGTAGQSAASGVVVPSPTPVWTSIYGYDYGVTNSQTISGISAPISISASNSGAATLFYVLNGVSTLYTGAFTARDGDVLAWSVAVGLTGKSGTITVTNGSDGGATLATITYVLVSTGGGGGRGVLP